MRYICSRSVLVVYVVVEAIFCVNMILHFSLKFKGYFGCILEHFGTDIGLQGESSEIDTFLLMQLLV